MTNAQQTVQVPATIEGWLQALTGAFTNTHRPDGTSYYHLSEAAYWEPIRDQLQAICREAHRGEFPNDWRYESTYDLAHALLSWCEADSEPWATEQFEDTAYQVADELASHSTVLLADWVSDNAGRGEFEDPELVEGLSPNIPTLLRWRQCEELQLMALAIIHACDQLTAAD